MSSTIQRYKGYGKRTVVDGATALPTPPVFVADVESTWNQGASTPREFDLEITAAGAVVLSNAELVGVVQDHHTIASDDVDTVDFANNELDVAAHGLLTGDGPIQLTTTGVLPTGLALETDYYVIESTAGIIQLATSLENALEGTVVTFSDIGSGTHSLEGSANGDPDNIGSSFFSGSDNSYRIKWLSYGLLGPAADGAITLSATKGYSNRVSHRGRTVAYAIEATLDTPIAMKACLYPVLAAR